MTITKRAYDQAQRNLAKAAKARRAAMKSKGTLLPLQHPLNVAYYKAKDILESME